MLFLWCKAEFASSLLQFSVSHDLLEIIIYLTLKKHVWLSMLKTILLLHICVEMVINFIFQDFLNSIYLHLSNILIKFVNAFIK